MSSRWNGPLSLSATDLAAALGQPPPTAAQQRVIEAAPTPALVVAGAGSGKTETMSGRVVWLVANGHVRRDEILGLTFTRKAAGELAERIGARLAVVDEFAHRGLLPCLPEIVASGEMTRINQAAPGRQREAVRRDVLDRLAQRYGTPTLVPSAEELMIQPRVSTYNAFADGVVREHAARIGRDPDSAMLSQAGSWLLARDVVLRADLPELENIDRSVDGIVDAVQRLAGDALDHRADLGRAARIAIEQADAFAPYCSEQEDSTATAIDRAVDNLRALPVLVELVNEYMAEKQRRGVLDFSDQVSGAYDIVESSAEVRAEIREQYKVVLLDEYQDTSVLQTRFLAELFRDSAVMAVGDPHQSIYGWRGASADNLYGFSGVFTRTESAQHYNLMTSWRNDQQILAVANRILEPLRQDGLEVPPLEPRPGAGPGSVQVRYPLTVDEEAAEVAAWFDERRAEHRGSAPHTGAILFRSKRHMHTFSAALAARGIPHRILGLGGLLAAPEVVDLVSTLRAIHDPTAGSALIRLLVGPRFGVGVADMAALHDLAKELAARDSALLPLPDEVRQRIRSSNGVEEAVSIIDAVDVVRGLRDDYRLLEHITPEGRRRIRAAGEMIERLRRASTQPLPELIRLIEFELRLDIELAVNETRGPARVATAALRDFGDEVRAFLSADERGTIGSLLAWLDRAERSDDLKPRSEPPEPGVVQLLTIHGSKGLEWDSVAVVRMVADELPARPSESSGWFGFGVLPFALRGDASALPRFSWLPPVDDEPDPAKRKKRGIASLQSKSKKSPGALSVFADENKAYQENEERRLAYVAVTRARNELLLTGSHWAGQTKPRSPGAYLIAALDACGLPAIDDVEPEENPYGGEGATLQWPMDPLGSRRERVTAASDAVRQALSQPAAPTEELTRLLAERAARLRGTDAEVPTRVPASRFKDYVTDFAGAVDNIVRPMPERPYRQTRLGTLFHSWVERRSELVGAGQSIDDALWEMDDDLAWASGDAADDSDVSESDAVDLAALQEIFEHSEWAPLQPIAVELEIDFVLGEHIVICKLDAVYRRESGRTEIVDWKTGKAPQTAAEREERMLQLALYRVAYHRRFGVPLEEIDVTLYYVADDLVIRDEVIYSEEDLVQRWSAARAAR